MTKQQIEEIVIEGLSNNIGCDKNSITLESKIVNDLGADSLDVIELIMKIESKFDIQISDEEAEKFITVGNAVNYLDSIINKQEN